MQQLEERLRAWGILPARLPANHAQPEPLRAIGQLQSATDRERLNFEAENAGMRAELSELRQRLKRFEAIKET